MVHKSEWHSIFAQWGRNEEMTTQIQTVCGIKTTTISEFFVSTDSCSTRGWQLIPGKRLTIKARQNWSEWHHTVATGNSQSIFSNSTGISRAPVEEKGLG